MVIANSTTAFSGKPLTAQSTGAPAIAFGGVNTGGSRYGLLRVMNNAQIDTIQQAQAKATEARSAHNTEEINGLKSHILECWWRNKRHKERSGIDEEMIEDLRQRDNEYDPTKLSAIESQGGTKVFMGLTNMKCRAGEAWLLDVLSSDQDKPWGLTPTPLPDLPREVTQAVVEETLLELQEHIQAGGEPVPTEAIADFAANMREDMEDRLAQEAEDRAAKMELKIHDQQVEGGWDDAFSTFITNMVTLKAGFIKGPVLRQKKKRVYVYENGKTSVVAKDTLMHEYYSPSPFDIYPSPGAVTCNQGDLIERIKYSRSALEKMKGIDGWDSAAIDLALLEYGRGGLRNWTSIDQERSELEDHGPNLSDQRDYMEGLEYWGDVQGRILLERGIKTDLAGKPLDFLSEYQVNCVLIGNFVVYRGLNVDPLGERPYSKTGWSLVPGSFWYKGVPRMMRDLQSIANATIRALVNNAAISSGPQVIYNDTSRIPIGDDVTALFPFKVHQFSNPGMSSLKPLEFSQPDMNAGELLSIYQAFASMSDEYTGIPSYAHGNDNVRGAGRTMGGLSMLMSSAARGIKMVIGRIDRQVVRTSVMRQFGWNMAYDADESIKGDVTVDAKGTLAMIAKEQISAKRMEFLNATNNPTDNQLMGLEFRRDVLKETAKSLDMAVRKFRTGEEWKEVQEQIKAQEQADMEAQQSQAIPQAA